MPSIQDRQVQVERAIIKIFYLGGFKYKNTKLYSIYKIS